MKLPFSIINVLFFIITIASLILAWQMAIHSGDMCRLLCEEKGGNETDFHYEMGKCRCRLPHYSNESLWPIINKTLTENIPPS